jgi:hypothetical protein
MRSFASTTGVKDGTQRWSPGEQSTQELGDAPTRLHRFSTQGATKLQSSRLCLEGDVGRRSIRPRSGTPERCQRHNDEVRRCSAHHIKICRIIATFNEQVGSRNQRIDMTVAKLTDNRLLSRRQKSKERAILTFGNRATG